MGVIYKLRSQKKLQEHSSYMKWPTLVYSFLSLFSLHLWACFSACSLSLWRVTVWITLSKNQLLQKTGAGINKTQGGRFYEIIFIWLLYDILADVSFSSSVVLHLVFIRRTWKVNSEEPESEEICVRQNYCVMNVIKSKKMH